MEQEEEDILTEDSAEDEFSDIESDYDDSSIDGGFGLDGSSETAIDKHGDLLKNLTDFNPFIQETFYGWIGFSWSEKNQKWMKDPNKRALMSLAGATDGANLLRTYARKNNIITNISSQDYAYIIEDLIETIYLNYGTREDYGVSNDGDLIMVCNQMLHCCQLVLMGAGDGKYNDLLTSTTHRNESVVVNPQTGLPHAGPPKSNGLQKLRNALLGEQ